MWCEATVQFNTPEPSHGKRGAQASTRSPAEEKEMLWRMIRGQTEAINNSGGSQWAWPQRSWTSEGGPGAWSRKSWTPGELPGTRPRHCKSYGTEADVEPANPEAGVEPRNPEAGVDSGNSGTSRPRDSESNPGTQEQVKILDMELLQKPDPEPPQRLEPVDLESNQWRMQDQRMLRDQKL